MTKQALPKTDIDSILLCIGFALLIVLAVVLAVQKISASVSSHNGETLYPRPTWTEPED